MRDELSDSIAALDVATEMRATSVLAGMWTVQRNRHDVVKGDAARIRATQVRVNRQITDTADPTIALIHLAWIEPFPFIAEHPCAALMHVAP